MPYPFALALVYAHIFFLPGALVLYAMREREPAFAPLLLAIPLSVAINFYLIVLLVATGTLGQPLLLSIIAVELCLVLVLARGLRPVGADAGAAYLQLLFLAAATAVFAPSLAAAFGQVFQQNDAVLSWNRWAASWSAGQFPTFTMTYPQLVPVTWATVYTALGEPLEFFARGLGPVFAVLSAVFIMSLGVIRARPAFAVAAAVNIYLTFLFLGPWLDDGYAETATMFMSIAALYPLLLLTPESGDAVVRRAALLSLFLATAVAHTKQAGVYLLVCHPLAFWLVLRELGLWRRNIFTGYLVWFALASSALVLPWYGLKQWQIAQGSERDIASYLVGAGGLHGDMSIYQRLAKGLALLWATLGSLGSWLIIIGLAAAALLNVNRWLIVVVICPFILQWAISFNYDTRNLALIIPALSIASVQGYAAVLRYLFAHVEVSRWRARRRLFQPWRPTARPALYATLAVMVFSALALAPSRATLRDIQLSQMKDRGFAGANAVACELSDRGLLAERFLTNDRWLEALPCVSGRFDPFYRHTDYHHFSEPAAIFADLNHLEAYLRTRRGDLKQILLVRDATPYAISDSLFAELAEAAAGGHYRMLAAGADYLLVEPVQPQDTK